LQFAATRLTLDTTFKIEKMGLLDGLLKMAMGAPKATESNQKAVTGIMDVLINNPQSNGLDGLLGNLTRGGLGNTVDSWISTGKNKSVSTGKLNKALGNDIISQVASKLGVSNTEALSLVAKFLPLIIDKLTPEGKVTAQSKSVKVQDILDMILKK
jgi:uncharacterized protein YidB (DUF937 family)